MEIEPAVTPLPNEGGAKGSRRLVGIGLMVLALICLTGLDSTAKWLGRSLPSLEITFFRYLVAVVLSGLVLNPLTTRDAWVTRRPWLQVLRGLCLLGSTVFNFMALRQLQLTETVSISFSVPFMVAVLSMLFLGETIGRHRWGAITVGFLGVMLVTRPTPSHFEPAMLLAFCSAICYSIYAIVTRKLSGVDSTASMLVLSAALPVLLLAPFMPAIWVWPATSLEWMLLVFTGACGAVGHFLMILAFARAPASVLSSFIYTQIVWMTLSGYLVFGDVPGVWTIAGGAVVIASGLYLVGHERRRSSVAPEATN